MKKIFIFIFLITQIAFAKDKKPFTFGGGDFGGGGAEGSYGEPDPPKAKPVKTAPAQPKPSTPIANIPADSCQWSSKLAPRLLNGRSCSGKNQGVCTGFVVCNEGGKKFKGLATCSVRNCDKSNDSALKCRQEKGYKSEFADIETESSESNTGKPAASKTTR